MESVVAVGTSIRGPEYVLRSEARNGGSPLSVRLNAEPLMIGDRQHVMVTLEEIAGNRSGSGNTEGA
jgi:hypothetical protein